MTVETDARVTIARINQTQARVGIRRRMGITVASNQGPQVQKSPGFDAIGRSALP
jgi:hypothetical protein